ncbi:enoyl-[acyl-carrier-protein] reductase FabK [Streptococcus uberis]|uniref:enoyl-[acyl-carrier-protein] reductase FabK n=1 Tax=Streptococcus uberis TaxID=1349 RepID=UPI002DDB281C|nr:enoyl-[acyl-carrier-protein] reductase FabK [Streptococcus uberis]
MNFYPQKKVTMKTRITELLNIKYPIFQGGMAWVADGDLAGAVSNAGGLGIIGGGNAPKEVVKANIDRVKSITKNPFGVNIMLLSPFVDDIVDLVIEEGVKVVTTGAGNPGKYMERLHAAGIIVIPVVPSVALAKRMEKLGVDAVITEGMEAGGHIGKLTTMTLVRQVVESISIPVIAAGGIADGRGAAAAFMLGAEAIQVGTRFVVAKESNAHQNFKDKILKAKDIDTVVSAQVVGHPVRSLKNKLTSAYAKAEKEFLADRKSAGDIEEMGAGALRNAVVDGDVEHGSVMAGQIAGLVQKEESCQDIIEDLFYGAADIIQKEAKRWQMVTKPK